MGMRSSSQSTGRSSSRMPRCSIKVAVIIRIRAGISNLTMEMGQQSALTIKIIIILKGRYIRKPIIKMTPRNIRKTPPLHPHFTKSSQICRKSLQNIPPRKCSIWTNHLSNNSPNNRRVSLHRHGTNRRLLSSHLPSLLTLISRTREHRTTTRLLSRATCRKCNLLSQSTSSPKTHIRVYSMGGSRTMGFRVDLKWSRHTSRIRWEKTILWVSSSQFPRIIKGSKPEVYNKRRATKHLTYNNKRWQDKNLIRI